MENGSFIDDLPIKRVILQFAMLAYVSLAEGKYLSISTVGSSWVHPTFLPRRKCISIYPWKQPLEAYFPAFSKQREVTEICNVVRKWNPETSRYLLFVRTLTKNWTPQDAKKLWDTKSQADLCICADRRSEYDVLVDIYIVYLILSLYLPVSQAAQSVQPSVQLSILFFHYSTLKSLVFCTHRAWPCL